MTEPAENYVSPYYPGYFRALALHVWAVTIAIVSLWVAAIVLGPVSRTGGWGIDAPIYSFFSYICHQLPERSFHFGAEPLAVCSRCFGVYFGLLAGLIVYPLWRKIDDIEPLPRIWLILSMIPIAIDWSLTVFGIWENTHLSRFITGLILGAACATYIVPALVEIRRNLAHRRRAAA
ncbi:MAG TPA: DUF2085 domain-containing protein [Pyrinomonadaceae bacterium]|jgi:uncharacterized membrane protein|nr:DUF2085 domain-containing protein [Pyrinomonadaceae bacterium]